MQRARSRDFELPPVKPILAALAALLLVIVVVMAIAGGGDDEGSDGAGGDDAADQEGTPARRGAKPRRPRPKPQKLAAEIGPRNLQFTAAVAERSRPQAVRATNRGGARIRIGKVRLEGAGRAGFVITDGCSGTRLSARQTCLVVVSFAPQRRRGADTSATLNASLVFTDDGRGGRQTVALRANRVGR